MKPTGEWSKSRFEMERTMPPGSQTTVDRLNRAAFDQAEDQEDDSDTEWINEHRDWLDNEGYRERRTKRSETPPPSERPRSQSRGPLDYAAANQSPDHPLYSTGTRGADTTVLGPHYTLTPAPSAGGFLETAPDLPSHSQPGHREGHFLGEQGSLYAFAFVPEDSDPTTGVDSPASPREDHRRLLSAGRSQSQLPSSSRSTSTVTSTAETETTTHSFVPSASTTSIAATSNTASSIGQRRAHECDGDGCDKTFASLNDLNHHKRCHLPYDLQCPICKKAFQEPRGLERHLPIHDPNRVRYYCQVIGCGSDFARPDGLLKHMGAFDSTKKPPVKCTPALVRAHRLYQASISSGSE